MTSFTAPRGTRDFSPDAMRKRRFVLETIRNVFATYGYPEIETPAFESWGVLAAKSGGGPEVAKEIFKFKDYGGRLLGLRFDLTVPMSRFIANNPQLPKPFKRSQIGRVWRYDRPQKGRYREFWQADVDVVGSSEVEADVETVTAIVAALKVLGFKGVIVKVNNRKLLTEIAVECGIPKENAPDLFRSVDKLEKQGLDYVKKELAEKGIKANKFLEIIQAEGKPEDILSRIEKTVKLKNNEPVERLKAFFKAAKSFGLYNDSVLDLSLARGLDYYTEFIFEIKLKGGEEYGSVAGGGRYDGLISLYGGEKTPATGISMGVERVIEIMEEKGMFKILDSPAKALVVPIGETTGKAVEIAQKLRKAGIKTDMDLLKRGPSKQLNYANTLNIPFAVIIGEKELKENKVSLRDMKTGKQELLTIEKTIERLK